MKNLKLAGKNLKQEAFLGGTVSQTYRVRETESGKCFILRLIPKPRFKDVKKIVERKQELFSSLMRDNAELCRKYGGFTSRAGYEMYMEALEGQVYIEYQLLKELSGHCFPKPVYFGQDDYAWYMLLDYIEGVTLYEYMENSSTLSEETVRSLMVQIAGGLQLLHNSRHGRFLYHNLTPMNLVVGEDGKVFLTDLFKVLMVDDETLEPARWQNLIFDQGPTPFSPVEGYKDVQAEIYALGVLFYYCLTGFFIQNASERLKADHLLPLREVRPECSLKMDKILGFCLELDPLRRFDSLEALKEAVGRPDFGALYASFDGKTGESFSIKKIYPGEEKYTEALLLKPLSIGAVPFLLERFSVEWKGDGSVQDRPSVRFAYFKETEEGVTCRFFVKTAQLMPAGEHRGKILIKSSWGLLELNVSVHIGRPIRWRCIAACIFAVLAACFLLFPRPQPSQLHLTWGEAWWKSVNNTAMLTDAPSFSFANPGQWERSGSALNAAVEGNSLSISGKDLARFAKSGLVSSVFAPAGSRFEMTVKLTDLKPGDPKAKAGFVFFDSSRNNICVEYIRPNIVRAGRYENGRWQFGEETVLDAFSGRLHIFLRYQSADARVSVFCQGKEIAVLPEYFIDGAFCFYGASLEDGGKADFQFSDFVFSPGPLIQKNYPYVMAVRGKQTVYHDPSSRSRYVFTAVDGEMLEVREKRDGWYRILSTEQPTVKEGWIKDFFLRMPLPGECLP